MLFSLFSLVSIWRDSSHDRIYFWRWRVMDWFQRHYDLHPWSNNDSYQTFSEGQQFHNSFQMLSQHLYGRITLSYFSVFRWVSFPWWWRISYTFFSVLNFIFYVTISLLVCFVGYDVFLTCVVSWYLGCFLSVYACWVWWHQSYNVSFYDHAIKFIYLLSTR